MKRLTSVLCATTLLLALTGCTSGSGYSNSTLTGQVTAIDGTSVTLQVGTLETDSMEAPSAEGEEQPEGQSRPSDIPEGSDETQDGQTPPEMPDTDSGETPSGEAPEDTPEGAPGNGSSFTAGDETVTLDLSDASIAEEAGAETTESTVDSITVGDILVVEVGSDGNATSVTVKNTGGGERQDGFGGSEEATQGTSATTVEADGTYTDEAHASSGDDENAVRIVGATVTLDGDYTISTLDNDGTIDFNGYAVTLADGAVLSA